MVGDTQPLRSPRECGIARPESEVVPECSRREQVRVDVAEPLPHESMVFDEAQDLGVGCKWRGWKTGPEIEELLPVAQIPTRQLTDDQGVHRHLSPLESGCEPRTA